MRLSVSTLSCPDWTVNEIIDRVAGYGYDAVDFRVVDGRPGLFILPEFTHESGRTRGRLRNANLAVSGFSTGARMFNPTPREMHRSLSEVREFARLCERFDAGMMRVFGGELAGVEPEAAVDSAGSTLEEMARLTAPTTVAVETHDDWVDTALLARVFQGVRAENVGIVWDLRHPWRHRGESPAQTMDNIGRWVVNVHVGDSRPLPGGDLENVLPGRGDVPVRDMIDRLRRAGYGGPLTVEWPRFWDKALAGPEEVLPAWAAFLRPLLEG